MIHCLYEKREYHISILWGTMRPRNVANWLDLYLGSQPIYIVSFGFPTISSSLLGDPNTRSSLSKLFSFSFLSHFSYYCYYSSLSFLQNCQPPPPPSRSILLLIA